MVNENGNGTNFIGMAADMIGGFKDSLFGAEGYLTDVNMLGMDRPLMEFNFLEQLSAQGGILPSLQTAVKKATAARRGGRGRTSAPPSRQSRYRQPAAQPPLLNDLKKYPQPPPGAPQRRSQDEQPNQYEIDL